jgi:hypothetical protein
VRCSVAYSSDWQKCKNLRILSVNKIVENCVLVRLFITITKCLRKEIGFILSHSFMVVWFSISGSAVWKSIMESRHGEAEQRTLCSWALYYHPSHSLQPPSLWMWPTHIQVMPTLPTPVSLEMPSQIHPEMCLTRILGTLNPIKLTTKVNHQHNASEKSIVFKY